MPGSSDSSRAASSNASSMAAKMGPCSAMARSLWQLELQCRDGRARCRVHARACEGSTWRTTARPRASFPTRAASTPTATAASCGRCGSSPASARRATPTAAIGRCSQAGGTGLSVAFDLPTLMGRDPDHPLALGEVGKCGVSVDVARRHGGALRRHRPRRRLDVDDDQLAGADAAGDVPGGGRAAGRAVDVAARDDPERHPQGVHRAEGVHLPAAPVDAAGHRHRRVLHRRRCRSGTPSR